MIDDVSIARILAPLFPEEDRYCKAGDRFIWLRAGSPEEDLELEAVYARPEHIDPDRDWLQHVVDGIGWAECIGAGAGCRDDMLKWLAENGVAPGQAFQVWMTYACWRSYDGEWDDDMTAEVVAVEPWDPRRIAAAWEAALEPPPEGP